MLLNSVYPIKTDTKITIHVQMLNIILYWIFLFTMGIKNQKLVEPHNTENGISPNSGI